MVCRSCGRELSNDPAEPNAGMWTKYEPRWPYCADSRDCERDVLGEWFDVTDHDLPWVYAAHAEHAVNAANTDQSVR